MRRVLVILAVLVIVAGAFAAGALIFRGDGDGEVVESQVHCIQYPGGTDDDCREVFRDERRALCADDSADAVKITIVYETDYENRITEDGRRTFTEDC